MLLKCPFAIEGRSPLWWRWSTASTLALVTLAASCLTVRGMAGWSSELVPATEAGPRTFRLPRLTIQQHEHDDQPFDLRFRMPDRFTLDFEVMAEPGELAGIEVLGHRLGSVDDPDLAPTTYRLWHRVRIVRASGAERVEVDGRPIPPRLGPGQARPLVDRPALDRADHTPPRPGTFLVNPRLNATVHTR